MYDRTRFIAQFLEEKTTYWCAKCETLLYEIGTAAFTVCIEKEASSTVSNLFLTVSWHNLAGGGSFYTFRYIYNYKKQCLYYSPICIY